MSNVDLIGSADAATILGVSRSQLQRMAALGEIATATRLSSRRGARLFERSAVEALAAERVNA